MPPEAATASARGLRDIGDLVQDAWEPIGRRFADLVAMAAMVLGPILAVFGPLLWLVLRDVELIEHYGPDPFGSAETVKGYELLGVGAPQVVAIVAAFALWSVAFALLSLGAMRLLAAEAQHVREPWQASLRQGARRFWRVVGTWILVGLLLFGASLAGIVLVAMTAIVPPLLIISVPALLVGLFYVGTRLILAPVVAAVGPRTLSPITAAWKVVGSNLFGVVGRLVVLWLVSIALGFAASIPGGIVQVVLPGVAGIVASGLFNLALQFFLVVYTLNWMILMWRDLGGELEQIVPPAPGIGGPVIDGSIDG
jgi:hypothetical protein